MQALASLADATRQLALDGHMNVLIVDVEGKVAGIDILFDSGQALGNRLLVLGTDDAWAANILACALEPAISCL